MIEEKPVDRHNRRFSKKSYGHWLLFIGDCKLLGDALANKPYTSIWLLLHFVNALLRGYGQVVFCNNPITGLLFVIGVTIANPFVSLTGLVTASFGLLVSVVSQQPKAAINVGLTTYNPLLLGLVTSSMLPVMYGLEMNVRLWLYLMIGVIFCVYITSALTSLMGSIGQYPLPFLTLPFIMIQIIIFLCIITTPVYNDKNLTSPSNLVSKLHSHHSAHLDNNDSTTDTRVKGDENVDKHLKFGMINEQAIRMSNKTPDGLIELEELHGQRREDIVDVLSTGKGETRVNNSMVQDMTEGFQESLMKEVSEKNEDSIDKHLPLVGDHYQQQKTTLSSSQMEDPYVINWGQVFTGVVLSVSQAFCICNVPVSLLMFLGVVIFSPITAGLYLLGATLGTLTGLLFCPAPYTAVYEGLWGFNGMLCMGAVGGFCFVITWHSVALALVSVVFAVCLQNVFSLLFDMVPIPILSIPFNISTLLFVCASAEGDTTLVRPDVLSFAEKHLYDFRKKLKGKRRQSSSSISTGYDGNQEKNVPLKEV